MTSMPWKKIIIYLIVAALGVQIYITWTHDIHPQSANLIQQLKTKIDSSTFSSSQLRPDQLVNQSAVSQREEGALVDVKTDVLHLEIDTQGGDIVGAWLLDYPVSISEKDRPIKILSNNPDVYYVSQVGFTHIGEGAVRYTAAKKHYVLGSGQKDVSVTLHGKTKKGLEITRTYTISRNSYTVSVSQTLKNNQSVAWTGQPFSQINQVKPLKQKGVVRARAYIGGAVSTADKPYRKVKYSWMEKHKLDIQSVGGWAAMQQHYFLSAWVPGDESATHQYYTHFNNNIYHIGFLGPQATAQPGGSVTSHSKLYVGPELTDRLEGVAPHLDLTIDYGWLWFISKFLFWVMSSIEHVLGNWGWSIVLTTVLIRLCFYHLNAKSFRSTATMKAVQPQMEALKQRFADDKAGLSRATMELYRKEKVNPLGGCLPVLVQIPVFIALYYVLSESVQLRQAPFIFWIHDLSVKDPYYVLPILMGLSMLVQQRLTPIADSAQAKMMMFLPVLFTVIFLNFPAGLVLYWLVNNCLGIVQQWYVMKTYKAKSKHRSSHRKKKR